MKETKSLRLLLVSSEKSFLSGLTLALKTHGDIDLAWAESGEKALDSVSNAPVDLVVTDEKLEDMTGLELVRQLLTINPMVNCATVSALSHEAFHEASEGLGLMAQLPPQPGEKEAEALLQQLRKLKNLTAGSTIFKTE